jgi:HK97 family phage major capsid protein
MTMNGRTKITAEVQRYQDEKLAREMLADVRSGEQARYHKAFTAYLLGRSDAELKDLQVNPDPAGGYLASRQFLAELVDAERQLLTMRRICRVLPPMPAEALEVPAQDSRLTDATWTGELLTGSADSAQPFGKRLFKPSPIAKYVKVSKKLLRQGGDFALRVIQEAIAEAVAVPQEAAFLTGSGASQPIGLLQEPNLPTYTTATSLTLAVADVKSWIYKLPGRWHQTARALMHVDTASVIGQIDANGSIIQNGLLLGKYPIEFSDQFPSGGTAPAALTANTIVAVIGDFSRYWIQDALDGLSVQRAVELDAPTNQDRFIARQETDAMAVDVGAFVALKIKP